MKTTLSKETIMCDVCGVKETHSSNSCLKCGKDYCWECQEKYAVEYRHSVHCSGSGDGTYCIDCDKQLKAADVKDPLHAAYLRIADLRKESERWYADFSQRSKDAEARLIEIQSASHDLNPNARMPTRAEGKSN